MSPGWQKYSGYTVWKHNLHYIFTKFFDLRHLYLLAARECRAGEGLCPVTWITMNHMPYWTQWHFKSLLAMQWSSHSAWMEGGREGRCNSEREGKKKKQKALSSAPVGQRHNCHPGSQALTPSNSSGSTTSVYRDHLNSWFRPRVQESTQGLGAWLAVNPHRTFLGSVSSTEKCMPPCLTLEISVHHCPLIKLHRCLWWHCLITYWPSLILSLYIWENWSPEMLRNWLKNHTAIGLYSHFYDFSRKKKTKNRLPLHSWFLVSSQLSVLDSLLKNKKETLTRYSLKNDWNNV